MRLKNIFEIYNLEITIISLLIITLYYPVLSWLFMRWSTDPTYSHGFLIPLISGFLIWHKREDLRNSKKISSTVGLAVIIFGLLLQFLCTITDINTVSSYSLIIVISGIILYLWGKEIFLKLLFPICFLAFMVPIFSFIINPISFELKHQVSKLTFNIIALTDIPIYREGVMIHLANASLEVANPCSGIQSLISLVALGALFAYIIPCSFPRKTIILLFTVPIAIISNVIRMVAFVLITHFFGISVISNDIFHEMAGLSVFVIALLCFFFMGRLICGNKK